MSDYSASPSDHHNEIQAPKRKATQAGLDGHATARALEGSLDLGKEAVETKREGRKT